MPDAILSVGSSSLAALLSGANGDAPVSKSTSARGTDPFAALLATATGTKPAAVTTKAVSTDTVAAVLASAAPAPGVAPVASAAAAASPVAVVNIVPVENAPIDTSAAPKAAVAIASADPVAETAPAPRAPADAPPVAPPATSSEAATDVVDPDLAPTAQPVAPVAGQPAQTASRPEPLTVAPVRTARPGPAPGTSAAPAVPAAETAPVAPEAAAAAPKDKNEDGDETPKRKDDSNDPLGDAIASGATAVLALAPNIVAPIVPQPVSTAPAEQPVRIDAPVAPRPLRLTPRTALPLPTAGKTQTPPVTAGASAEQAAAVLPDTDMPQAEADADARRQPARATDARPAATQLSPEVAKAVAAALKRTDAAPSKEDDAAPLVAAPDASTANVDAAQATAVAKPRGEQAPEPIVKQAQQQAAPVQSQPAVRRRSDDVPAPRRASDARKRVDPVLSDAASATTPQRTAETPRTGFALAADAASKGDAIVEQTLTIAKDGAWLDRLAKDIAGAGSGNDLHFKLNPENLGALSVAISQKDDGASIRLTADNQATRDILVDAQPKLIAEARAQGLKVSDTQVDVRQDDRQNQSQGQSNSQDHQRWAQNQNGQPGQQAQTGHNGQNRQSSPEHKPFVSNLGRKANEESESPARDSDALYA